MSYYDYNYGYQYPNMVAPQYAPPQQNLYQQQMMQQNCQCDNRFMWIQGKEAAKAYPVAPDKTVFFLDDKESYAYLKKTDREGKTTEFKVFQLIEEKEGTQEETKLTNNFITKDEFDTFSSAVDTALDNLMAKIDSISNKPYNKQQYNNNRKQVRNNG